MEYIITKQFTAEIKTNKQIYSASFNTWDELEQWWANILNLLEVVNEPESVLSITDLTEDQINERLKEIEADEGMARINIIYAKADGDNEYILTNYDYLNELRQEHSLLIEARNKMH